MNLKLTKYNLDRFEKQDTITLAEVMGFFHDFSRDLENQDLYLDEIESGETEQVARWLPWLSLFAHDTYQGIRDDMTPGVGKTKLDSLQDKLIDIHDEMTEYAKLIEERQAELNAAEKEQAKLEEMRDSYADLSRQLEELKCQKQEALASREAYEEMIDRTKKEVIKLQETNVALAQELGEKKIEYRSRETEAENIQKSLDQAQREYDELRKRIDEGTRRILELNNAGEENREKYQQCRRIYQELCDKAGKQQEEIRMLQGKIEEARQKLSDGELESLKRELTYTEETLVRQVQACEEAKETIRLTQREIEEQKRIFEDTLKIMREKDQEKQKYVNMQSHLMSDFPGF